MNIQELFNKVKGNNPGESEFIQAVHEVLESISEVYDDYPEFERYNLLERLVEPDRIVIFRVPWMDDEGNVQVNRGFRVQFNGALGPYKGGLRFHPNVSLGTFKFLGFEQMFKNALTGLPLGAGKGGSDFNPKGKSDTEVMRFCQSFMTELQRHIGPETDVPAGDIGVGGREIGYLYGQYRKLSNRFEGVLTGKGLQWGGSWNRTEATGYGIIYFVKEILKAHNDTIEGKTVTVSGFGNVAWGAIKKLNELGAKVVTISGPDGYIYDEEGICDKKVEYLLQLRASNMDVVAPYAEKFSSAQFFEGKRPWEIDCDIAIPCAIQNELELDDAQKLVNGRCKYVCEGANMPCTPEAIDLFYKNDVVFAPGKAANAGGVAVSGLEMSQNSMKLQWTPEEVDMRLQQIMKNIHESCMQHGSSDGKIDYIKGANIAGFLKVAFAIIDQGVL
ncbi:MAG: NADP-specific glutamate dehydrogenase [Bacteroidales bacterium]|nr:NADP-specific glutamate dehydrogenase [Bacteroidales bacterium]